MPRRHKSRGGNAASNLPKDKEPPKPQTALKLNTQGNTPVAPDPLGLGDSFDKIVAYMRNQGHHDLISGAQDHLAKSVSEVINRLQSNLRELHINKDSPALYPDYVLDGDRPMKILVWLPFALIKFHHLFEQYLLQMLGQCGLNATSTYMDLASKGVITLDIKFQPGFIQDNTQTIKNRVFEVGYQRELLAGIKNLRIES